MSGELKIFGVEDESPLYKGLPVYLKELSEWNRQMNLVGPDHGDFRERHIYDCLAGLPKIRALNVRNLVDIGTGAGLPGILLAMAMPETDVLLVEKSPKKCRFLKHVIKTCALSNVRVFNGRAGELSEKMDLVVFRAVSPLALQFLGELKGLCRTDTLLAAYKGRKEKIDQELVQAETLIKDPEVLPLNVPGLKEERHLVLFRLKL